MDYEELGRNMRLQRTHRGLKQCELADRVGVSAQHVCHIETCRTKPSLETFVIIVNELHSDANTLLGKNLTNSRTAVLTGRIAQILSGATPAQLELCADVCESIVKRQID